MSIFEYSGRKEIITRRKTFDDRFEALFFFFFFCGQSIFI